MRIALHTPTHCSSCFAQQPEMLHVDFESAWDGPVLNADGVRVSIDDLFICEDCLRAALALLPEHDDHDRQIVELGAELDRWVKYSARMQEAHEKLVLAQQEKPEGSKRGTRKRAA